MIFDYTYRSSDGQRHSGTIESESRDAAYAAIRRELGVKPIKVTAAGEGAKGPEAGGGRADARPYRFTTAIAVVAVAAVLLLAGGVWWWRAAHSPNAPYQVMTPQGVVTCTVAQPLPRQPIPGDRSRIEAAYETAFRSSAEVFLARFAEPGRPVNDRGEARPSRNGEGAAGSGGGASARPGNTDFEECLKEPVMVVSTDFTEVVDLKRIVSGMKREMRAYLAGGGTVEQYLMELAKRQRLEVSYRERAEQRLGELLKNVGRGEAQTSQGGDDGIKPAYEYWLKANASLKSMGIYELPLPDALRGYQASIGIDE